MKAIKINENTTEEELISALEIWRKRLKRIMPLQFDRSVHWRKRNKASLLYSTLRMKINSFGMFLCLSRAANKFNSNASRVQDELFKAENK